MEEDILRKSHLSRDPADDWCEAGKERDRIPDGGDPVGQASGLQPHSLQTTARASPIVSPLHLLTAPCCKRLEAETILGSKGLTTASPCTNIFSESLLPQSKVSFKDLMVLDGQANPNCSQLSLHPHTSPLLAFSLPKMPPNSWGQDPTHSSDTTSSMTFFPANSS